MHLSQWDFSQFLQSRWLCLAIQPRLFRCKISIHDISVNRYCNQKKSHKIFSGYEKSRVFFELNKS